MDWRLKALAQGVFSNIPFGSRVNYLVQRHVTRSLPVSETEFKSVVAMATNHFGSLERHFSRPLQSATFYEFGAGWDLVVPFAFCSLGVQRQIVTDILPLARPELIGETITRCQQANKKFPGSPKRLWNGHGDKFTTYLQECYGIEYRAPCDARRTSLHAGSIDCITSTNTLEHIPPVSIREIFTECHRLLRPDGVMSFLIDYEDHYSYFDKTISGYNFLKYSDLYWKFLSPSLQYQNRLRHKDYIQMLESAGFEVIEEQRQDGDLEALAAISVAERFKHYTPEELAVRNSYILARKHKAS